MVINWKQTEGTQETKPALLDMDSSSLYVYLRQNIERSSKKEDDGNVVFYWSYEEAKLTMEEYEQYLKETNDVTIAMMMQQMNDLQASQELTDITVDSNHEEQMQLMNDMAADIAMLLPEEMEE